MSIIFFSFFFCGSSFVGLHSPSFPLLRSPFPCLMPSRFPARHGFSRPRPLLSISPLLVCVVLYVTNFLSTACEAGRDGEVDIDGIVASVLLGVFSLIVLWRLAQVKRRTKWSQQPPLPNNTRIQLFFRSHSDMQKLCVFLMLSCAVMLLAALATDRYLVDGKGYYARTVGAFIYGDRMWTASCEYVSGWVQCNAALAASVLVFLALLAALIGQ